MTPLAAALLLAAWLPLASLACATPAPAPGPPAPADAAITRLETNLARRVNALRAEHGLRPLRREAALARIARVHSVDMARRGVLTHRTSDGVGPVARVERTGLRGFSLVAENVGLTSRLHPNAEILRAWLASPEHRANLLGPAFEASGIGIARAADGTLYYTQDFVAFRRSGRSERPRKQ